MFKLKVFLSTFTLLLLASSISFGALKEVKGCRTSVEADLRGVANYIKNNWDDFEDFVEDETGLNIKSCMKNRFSKNGKIECESRMTGYCSGANGWAIPGSKRIHLCPDFVTRVRNMSQGRNRRACYLALMAHEFAHTCARFERGSELIDDASFDYYDMMKNVSISLASCGMD